VQDEQAAPRSSLVAGAAEDRGSGSLAVALSCVRQPHMESVWPPLHHIVGAVAEAAHESRAFGRRGSQEEPADIGSAPRERGREGDGERGLLRYSSQSM